METMAQETMALLHGTCVEIDGHGVLLRGTPGSGKSDLALRLMAAGGILVADDQVELHRAGKGLMARPPATLAGLIEVRGIGVLEVQYSPEAALAAVVDLGTPDSIERMPEEREAALLDVYLPRFTLAPFEASAAAKVRLAVAVAAGVILRRQ